MKKAISILLLAILLITISACNKTEINDNPPTNTEEIEENLPIATTDKPNIGIDTPQLPLENPFEVYGMPPAFYDLQSGGGNSYLGVFAIPIYEDRGNGGVSGIQSCLIDAFVEDDDFYEWIENPEMKKYVNEPQISLMGYPNLYSFIKTFDIPVDEVTRLLKEDQLWRINDGQNDEYDYYTDEEIALICSLDEAAIMEYFVSDYSIYHDGAAYPPMWFYCNTPEEYTKVGITSEMLEEKLDLYAEFTFTEEAEVAFSEKLSEFMAEDVSLKEIRSQDSRSADSVQ